MYGTAALSHSAVGKASPTASVANCSSLFLTQALIHARASTEPTRLAVTPPIPIKPLSEAWICDTSVSLETDHLCRKSAQLSLIHCGIEPRDTNICH